MTTNRKRYTKEFKEEAVRLLEHGDKPPAVLARELAPATYIGVSVHKIKERIWNYLYLWNYLELL